MFPMSGVGFMGRGKVIGCPKEALIYILELEKYITVPLSDKTAICDLIKSLISTGIWGKIKVFHPIYGNDENAHSINCKNPTTFALSFSSVGHSQFGIIATTNTGEAILPGSPNTIYSDVNNCGISFWLNANYSGETIRRSFGLVASGPFFQNSVSTSQANNIPNIGATILPVGSRPLGYSETRGFYTLVRDSAAMLIQYKNGVNNFNFQQSGSLSSVNLRYLGRAGNSQSHDLSHHSCFVLHEFLDQDESKNLYEIIQSFQYALGRGF